MRIERHYTKAGQSPYAALEFRTTKSEIRNPDGSIVFSLEGIEVPASWSQVAADVLAQKYFRKAGVPARLKRVEENNVPSFLWRSINDDLVNEGGIMDLWVREARLFKYGSGTGTNFSALRGENEKLSGGGRSSGLMSFLKIGDRAAGAIKSGGTTRRAAKMVIVDVDHPDIEDFIDWKVIEEQKVAALVAGSKLAERHLKAVLKACVNCEGSGRDCYDPAKNPALRREIKAARKSMIPDNYIERVISFARQGFKDIDFKTYDTDWDSEAYTSVSGQNSN